MADQFDTKRAEIKVSGRSIGFFNVPKTLDLQASWDAFKIKYAHEEFEKPDWDKKFKSYLVGQGLEADLNLSDATDHYNFG